MEYLHSVEHDMTPDRALWWLAMITLAPFIGITLGYILA